MQTAEIGQKFLEDCRRRELAPKTIEYYRWCLNKLVEKCPKWPETVEQVAAAWDSPKLNRTSREDVERGLRIIMFWAEKHHNCPNVLRDTKKMSYTKTLPRVFQEDEIAAVWEACESAQEKAWVALLLDTGIRLGELAGLRWPDVGPASITVTGKTGPRVVPVSPPVREMLTGLGDETHIWVSRNGPMGPYAIQSAIRSLFGRAGLTGPKLGPHTMRHSFGTHYIADGGNVFSLQEIMGHKSITTTQRYVHLAAAMTKGDHKLHSPAARMLPGLPPTP